MGDAFGPGSCPSGRAPSFVGVSIAYATIDPYRKQPAKEPDSAHNGTHSARPSGLAALRATQPPSPALPPLARREGKGRLATNATPARYITT